MKNGFNHYYRSLNLRTGDLRFLYDFTGVSTTLVPSVSYADPQHSGELSYLGGFAGTDGSGAFTGQTINVSNASAIPNNFTIMFSFEKTDSGKMTLFSSLQNNTTPSGFVFGVNDTNKLYVETYNDSGNISKVSSIPLARGNIVALTKAGNAFTVMRHNFLRGRMDSEVMNFPRSYPNSNTMTIAGAPNAPSAIEHKTFSGYIDNAALVSSPLNKGVVNRLASGFYTTYPSASLFQVLDEDVQYSYRNLTGYATGLTMNPITDSMSYMQTNYFGDSGVGTLTATLSGNINGGIWDISGSVKGTLAKWANKIASTEVTGYTTGANYTGVTGWSFVKFGEIHNVAQSIENISGYSGTLGVLTTQVPLYGNVTKTVRDYFTGFVTYNDTVSFTKPALAREVAQDNYYVHTAKYHFDGYSNRQVKHAVKYNNESVQPTDFWMYKTVQQKLGDNSGTPVIDGSYMSGGYRMDGLCFLRHIDSGDKNSIIRFQSATRNPNQFGKLDGGKSMLSYNKTPINHQHVYVNGIYLIPSGYSISSTRPTAYSYSGDYFNSGIRLSTSLQMDFDDELIFDQQPNNLRHRLITPTGLGNSTSNQPSTTLSFNNNALYFLNGVLLTSGVDYIHSGGNFYVSGVGWPDVTGILAALETTSGSVVRTDSSGSFPSFVDFLQGPQVWLNGARQKRGEDYIERSSHDYLNGTGVYGQVDTGIMNNSINFWV